MNGSERKMKRGTIEHPKMAMLCKALNVPRYAAVGLMESLWHATAKYHRRGNIGAWTNEKIANAIDWRKDPDALIDALVRCGWIDLHPTHRLVVHDWSIHCDDATKKAVARNKETWADSGVACRDMSGHEATNDDSPRLPKPKPMPLPVQSNPSSSITPPVLPTTARRVARWGDVDWTGTVMLREVLQDLRVWPVVIDHLLGAPDGSTDGIEPALEVAEVRRLVEWVQSDASVRNAPAVFVHRLYRDRGILDELPRNPADQNWEKTRERILTRLRAAGEASAAKAAKAAKAASRSAGS